MEGGSDSLLVWLNHLNLAEYHQLLVARGLVSRELLAQSVRECDQLTAIGINKMGHRNRLYRAIEKLREEGTAPPVPIRNNRSASNLGSSTLHPNLLRSSSPLTPPPPKRNQSLRRKTPSPDTGPSEMATSPLPGPASVNGTHSSDRPSRPGSESVAALTSACLPSPIAPRRQAPSSPTPKPRNSRPIPTPRHSKSPSPVPDVGPKRLAGTLPNASVANGDVPTSSLLKSHNSNTMSAHHPSSVQPRRMVSSPSAPPPPPARKKSKENPPEAGRPVLPSKTIHTLPLKERPKPPPPFSTSLSAGKPAAAFKSNSVKPNPPPRSAVSSGPPSHTAKGSIMFLSGKNQIDQDLSSSEDEGVQEKAVVPSAQTTGLSGDSGNGSTSTAPQAVRPSQAAEKSEDSDFSDQDIEGSLRKMVAVRQLSSGVLRDHEDDIIMGTMGTRVSSGPDYMNQKSIDSALADISGDDEEEEEMEPGKRLVISQVKQSHSSEEEEEEEEVSPLNRLVIGQVKSADRNCDQTSTDQVLAMTMDSKNRDYVNQDELKNDEGNKEEEEEEEEEEDRAVKVAIHGQKEDYVNQAELDKMEVLSPGGVAAGEGFLDLNGIGLDLNSKPAPEADYVNDTNLVGGANVLGDGGRDYVNQGKGKGSISKEPDYVNQGGEGEENFDEDEFWKSIESFNRANKIVLKTVALKNGSGGSSNSSKSRGYSNLGSQTQEIGDTSSMDDYLTDDYCTTDDDDDDEKINRRNTIKARLRIRSTLKSPQQEADLNNDYANQELLEEDIIPMMVAPDAEALDFLKTAATHRSSVVEEVSLKMHHEAAETSGHDDRGLVSPTGSSSTDDQDGVMRAPVCNRDTNESTLDFHCSRGISNPVDPPPLPPKSPPVTTPTSPLSQLALTTHMSPESHSRSSTTSSTASSVCKMLKRLSMEEEELPVEMETLTAAPQPDSFPPISKPRSHTFVDVLEERQIAVPPTSPRRGDVDFLTSSDRGLLSPNHAVLPKSSGTFAGGDSFKRPAKAMSQISMPSMMKRRELRAETLSESSLLPGISVRLGSNSIQDVPKTKEGFLYKKGGRRNERPWQKRWVTFNGSELKYFKNKSDKDNLFLNAVELEKMFDVKKVADEEKQYRFDLVVVNRVFQFYSESVDDCQAWVDVLHVAISKFKPQDHEHKVGGSMHDPDKEGYLHKQGHGAFSSKSFRERYVALKGSKFSYYDSYELYKLGRPIHTLDMCLSSVRPDMTSKVPRFIITMNNQKQYHFQALTDLERNDWITALTNAILTGIETRPQTLPRGGSKSMNSSQVVLSSVQENPANKTCADCSASDPVWGVINRGIMVCINCSGVHRSFGAHISKVRSIELDEEVWKNENLKQLMVVIGNHNSNQFWEKYYKGEKLTSNVEKEIREEFLRAKYLTRSWIPSSEGHTKDSLNQQLCKNVSTPNILRTIELLALGADSCCVVEGEEDPEKSSPLAIAQSSQQPLQAELLELNGASICRRSEQSYTIISKKGHLFKTGSDRTGWKKRYCTLDQFRGFQYFKLETDGTSLGDIRVEELLSVEKCEEEVSREHRHCFEVNTQGRGYLFSAESETELVDWIDTFQKIISSDAAENLGYDKVGYLKKKDPLSVGGWRRRWYTLKGKTLACYKREREEQDEIDLRKVVMLKGPEASTSGDQLCVFYIITDEKTYQLKAESPADVESWMSALRHTQVSGIPLAEQLLTNSNVPIIVHKCLQFVESTGIDMEGLYRISGEKAKIRKLILAFNQDAQGMVIDPEKYNVHDVTGTLKQFLRSLPHPVLTHDLYHQFIATVQTEHEAQLYTMQNLIQQLPEVNRETLKRIVLHLRRVIDNQGKNKMNEINITRLLGPTLMTVDGDEESFQDTPFQYKCIYRLIVYYKWLFKVEEDENKKEEAIEEAVQKIKELELQQKKRLEMVSSKQSTISSATDFLTTVYIEMRDGDSFNTNINGTTTVQQVVENTIANRGLPPDKYALYLILGDTESQRVLCFSERLLGIMVGAGTEHFLCLRRNEFYEALEPHFPTCSSDPVSIHVKEKKRWKKYPCCVKDGHFIQYKDSKGHSEVYKIPVHSFDVFAGIQRSKLDVRNPMPSRYGFWIKAMKGEEQSRYFCVDKQEHMMKIMATIIKAKYSSCLQSPILPQRTESSPPPPSYSDLYQSTS